MIRVDFNGETYNVLLNETIWSRHYDMYEAQDEERNVRRLFRAGRL